jgi:hypothetical protein
MQVQQFSKTKNNIFFVMVALKIRQSLPLKNIPANIPGCIQELSTELRQADQKSAQNSTKIDPYRFSMLFSGYGPIIFQ